MRSILFWVAVLIIPGVCSGQYDFQKLVTTSGTYDATWPPALNDAGAISFKGVKGSTSGIYRVTSGVTQTIASSPGTFSSFDEVTSINNLGNVAFYGSSSVHGIYFGNGISLTTIADTSGPLSPFMGPPSINNLGQVSFHSSRDAGGNGIFRGVGVPVSPVNIALTGATYAGFGRNTANNESGQVAFRAGIVSGGDALLIGNGISTTTVATTSGPFFAFDALSINDSGQVAFSAMNDDGSFGVYFYNGSTISTIATTSSYSRFGSVNLSNSGMVAFYAEVANSIDQGIFYGPNPAVNKLIRVGDNLDGGIVGNIAFSPFGLNNNNQFAFTASVGSGTGMYLATAVPEPVTIALVCLIAAGAGAVCWRTRAIFQRLIHQEVELPE